MINLEKIENTIRRIDKGQIEKVTSGTNPQRKKELYFFIKFSPEALEKYGKESLRKKWKEEIIMIIDMQSTGKKQDYEVKVIVYDDTTLKM